MKQARVTITHYKTVVKDGRPEKEPQEQKTMWARLKGLSASHSTSNLEITQRESMELELRTCEFTRQMYQNTKNYMLDYQGNEYSITAADGGNKPDMWLRFRAYRAS